MTAITVLNQKRIVLGVTGSIAAYKSVELASKLTQAGALVDVILTEAAQQFVTALTFQSVTGRPVYTSLWASPSAASALPTHIAHVGLGESAELILIAPATANTLAKLAHGLAEDLLSVTVLAGRCPLVLAPAMDGGMYRHPATQANLDRLKAYGALVIEPEEGRFASGLQGLGRLPEPATLLGHVRRIIGSHSGSLKGRQIVVTAGGTREALDPVRYISNHSSGKQGYAIAQAALDAGASVKLISTVDQPTPVGAELLAVDSAAQMRDAVLAHIQCDALVMAAAVADFRPATAAEQKIKKGDADLTLELVKNDDILLLVSQQRPNSGYPLVVVGFAAETQKVIEYGRDKLEKKKLDLLVANDLTQAGAGFAGDTNIVTLITRQQQPEVLPKISKTEVAEIIMRRVADLLDSGTKSQ